MKDYILEWRTAYCRIKLMTLYDMTTTENGLRAIMVEQYEDMRALIPTWADAMLMCCEEEGNGSVKSIVLFEEKKNVAIDCGVMEIMKCQPAKGMELNLEAIRENDVPPSLIMTEEMIQTITGISFTLSLSDQPYPVEVICILESESDSDRNVPLIIVELDNTKNKQVDKDAVFLAVGFIQHTLTSASSMHLVDMYIQAEKAEKKAKRKRRKTTPKVDDKKEIE